MNVPVDLLKVAGLLDIIRKRRFMMKWIKFWVIKRNKYPRIGYSLKLEKWKTDYIEYIDFSCIPRFHLI